MPTMDSLQQQMDFASLPLPEFLKEKWKNYIYLTPIQQKAVQAGVLEGKSLLVCAPTASGKTLIASLAIGKVLGTGKTIYVVPLKALAKEKFREYQQLLEGTPYRAAIATGDLDAPDSRFLANADVLVLTSEKLDSLLRHQVPWLSQIKLVVVDEIHLLNDPTRGPTLEIILTLLLYRQLQLIGLSATIGNPQELAEWLKVTLIQDTWRPVELRQGIMAEGKLKFY